MQTTPGSRSWRSRLHEIIYETNTPAGKVFDVALLFFIVASTVYPKYMPTTNIFFLSYNKVNLAKIFIRKL